METLVEDKFVLEQAISNQNCVLYSSFRKAAEIIPLGFSAECALLRVKNQKYVKISDEEIQCHHINVFIKEFQIGSYSDFINKPILVKINENLVNHIKENSEFLLKYQQNLVSLMDRKLVLQNL